MPPEDGTILAFQTFEKKTISRHGQPTDSEDREQILDDPMILDVVTHPGWPSKENAQSPWSNLDVRFAPQSRAALSSRRSFQVDRERGSQCRLPQLRAPSSVLNTRDRLRIFDT